MRRTKLKPDTWMPLYPGDYLRDTMHLDAEGHGAYVLLIMAYWSNGGPIPSNEEWLRNVCRVKESSWMRVKGLVMPFFKAEGDTLRHKRIDEELENAISTTEARRKAGIAGNAARWGIANESQTHRNAIANASQKHPPSPSPSPSPKEREREEGARSLSFAERPDWDEWWHYCQMIGMAAEWFAKDKFLAAEADSWAGKTNWKAYAARVKAWWEQDGRKMKPPTKAGQGQPQKESAFLREIRNMKV